MAAVARDQAAVGRTSSTRTIRTASRWRRWRCRCSTRTPTPPLVASRRVDFHLKRNSFSRWKYRQVDCFIAASDAIRDLLVADGVAAATRRHRPRGHRRRTASRASRRSNVHEAVLAAAPRAGRRQRRRAGAAQGPAAPDRRAARSLAQVPDARFVILGEGELRAAARAPGQAAPPREARRAAGLPRRRPGVHQGRSTCS